MLDDIKKTLWATADKQRANMDAAKYEHMVLGLALKQPRCCLFNGAAAGERW